ncbi:MAG: hypothetical protein DRO04_02875 [Candidatus Iainarchaeum archaeon]|uniref:Xylose isomerase-like TIM barrel domain-containing protein n=1 Tax=Candidatus Iainarchaeum sp. TaxID=3101447 RepID=A0A497JGT2_9ARCH|nr:MAG: hypothetical protein DRO04_02875 [Candidatus Diapherotrites archaeon]
MIDKWSIWTSYFHDLPVSEALKEFSRLGFKWLELSSEHMNEVIYVKEGEKYLDRTSFHRTIKMARKYKTNFAEIDGLFENLNLSFCHAHGPFDVTERYPILLQNWVERGIEKLEKWFHYYNQVGVDTVVIHPLFLKVVDQFEKNILFFKKVVKLAEDYSLKIALENRIKIEEYGSSVKQLIRIIEEVNSDLLGICLDTGHANVQVYRNNVEKAVLESKEFLIATHINDNHGKRDEHLFPGKGIINWSNVLKAFQEIGYSKPLNLEVPGECNTTLEERKEKLKKFLENFKLLHS